MSALKIDSHIHIYTRDCIPFFRQYRQDYGFDAVNVACLCMEGAGSASNLLAAILKLEDEHFYAHGSLFYPEMPARPMEGDLEFAAQAKELIAMGFDGIKLLESKPTVRKAHGMGLNDMSYDAFFSYMEESGEHLIWHACDPETFWNADTAPEFAFKEGWFYGDGSFSTKEQLYYEVRDVLHRHPRLNATFAHFFFLSDFPDAASEFLDKYPFVTLDITPGREMYDYFTRRREIWRRFFDKYANRIVFGTDMTADAFQGSPDELIGFMRRFLRTDEKFSGWGFDMHGLALSQEAVDLIEGGNYAHLVAPAPRKIDRKLLGKYAERMLPYVKSDEDRVFMADYFEKNL